MWWGKKGIANEGIKLAKFYVMIWRRARRPVVTLRRRFAAALLPRLVTVQELENIRSKARVSLARWEQQNRDPGPQSQAQTLRGPYRIFMSESPLRRPGPPSHSG